MDEFQAHLAELTAELAGQRSRLLSTLDELSDADLERARRGGWTVAKVLQHVLDAEWHYARLITDLRGQPGFARDHQPGAGLDRLRQGLGQSRSALFHALEGVTEDDFYRLGALGHEEYSVASVLENVAQHDIEHMGQIASIRAG